LKKPILILAISASFVVGTLVAGNLVFAAPADSQNELLSVILQEVEALNSFIGTPETPHAMEAFVIGTLICPNLDEIPYDFILKLDNTGSGRGIVVGSPRGQQGVGQISSSHVFGQSDLTNFSLEAIVEDATCSIPTLREAVVVTISGNCGLSETISFSTSIGITGTFSGRVACI